MPWRPASPARHRASPHDRARLHRHRRGESRADRCAACGIGPPAGDGQLLATGALPPAKPAWPPPDARAAGTRVVAAGARQRTRLEMIARQRQPVPDRAAELPGQRGRGSIVLGPVDSVRPWPRGRHAEVIPQTRAHPGEEGIGMLIPQRDADGIAQETLLVQRVGGRIDSHRHRSVGRREARNAGGIWRYFPHRHLTPWGSGRVATRRVTAAHRACRAPRARKSRRPAAAHRRRPVVPG